MDSTRPTTRVRRKVQKGETQGFIGISADAESKYILGAATLVTGGDEQQPMNIYPTVSQRMSAVMEDIKPLPVAEKSK